MESYVATAENYSFYLGLIYVFWALMLGGLIIQTVAAHQKTKARKKDVEGVGTPQIHS